MSRSRQAMLPLGHTLAGIGALCVFGIIVFQLVGGPWKHAASAAMVFATLIVVGVAALGTPRENAATRSLREVAIAIAALASVFPAAVFGPNSGFAVIVALLLIVAGLMTGAGIKRSVFDGWLIYAAFALSQAALFTAVLFGFVPDASVIEVVVGQHPDWHHALGHAGLQTIYFAAFVSGRILRKRYRRLQADTEESLYRAARRDALLAEARAEYQQAVRNARAGIESTGMSSPALAVELTPSVPDSSMFATFGVLTATEPTLIPVRSALSITSTQTGSALPATCVVNSPRASSEEPTLTGEVDDASAAILRARAYGDKLRTMTVFLSMLCLVGAALFAVIIRDSIALIAALVGFTGVIGGAWLHHFACRAQPYARWPWVISIISSVGPCYAIGFNSGFTAAIAVALFLSALFHCRSDNHRRVPRGPIVLAGALAHAVMAALVATEVIADRGNIALVGDNRPLALALALHGVIIVFYGLAYALGRAVDRRWHAMVLEAEEATRAAAHQEELLRTARAELDRLLAGGQRGLFGGAEVAGYTLGRLLGRGGMGEVYEATRADGSGDRVALKLIRSDRVADPGYLMRFVGEAEALQRIDCPMVARVIDASGVESPLPYIAMEYIEGTSLATMLKNGGSLSATELYQLVSDVGAGLAAVHRAGLVHRDIKPANLIHQPGRGWKIVDFGVAVEPNGSREQRPVGTPGYMSPEQARCEELDARSDLHSLGLVLYRAVTGTLAIAGNQRVRLSLTRRRGSILDPAALARLDPDVNLVLRLATAFDPTARFSCATDMRRAFRTALAGALAPELRNRARALLEVDPWRQPDLRGEVHFASAG